MQKVLSSGTEVQRVFLFEWRESAEQYECRSKVIDPLDFAPALTSHSDSITNVSNLCRGAEGPAEKAEFQLSPQVLHSDDQDELNAQKLVYW